MLDEVKEEVCLPYRGLRTEARRATCRAPEGERLHINLGGRP